MNIEILKNKLHSIERKHPWIFSDAINSEISEIQNGEIVTAVDKKGNFLVRGHFQHATISLRVLTFIDQGIDQYFFNQKIPKSLEVRQKQNIISKYNNICRLVHGEGEYLKGLVIQVD